MTTEDTEGRKTFYLDPPPGICRECGLLNCKTHAAEDDVQAHIERLQHRAKNVLWYFRNHPELALLMEKNEPMRTDVRELSAAVYND